MHQNFERLLANHCAPLLFGKKPAILLAKKNFPKNYELGLLWQYGFRELRLYRAKGQALIFLYHPALLKEAVSNPITVQTLSEMGYSYTDGLIGLLAFLRRRFMESSEFPHEVGFFLGYPAEDVVGFLSCNDHCKLCGQWKVCSDVERATILFDEYSRCKQTLLNHIEKGTSIFSIITPISAGENYKEAHLC